MKALKVGDRVHLVSNERFTFLGIEVDPARRLEGEVVDVSSLDDRVKVRLDRELGTIHIGIDRVNFLWRSCDTEDCPGDREPGSDYCYDCIRERLDA